MKKEVRESCQEAKENAQEAVKHCLALRSLFNGRNGSH